MDYDCYPLSNQTAWGVVTDEDYEDMAWTKPLFSRNQIDKAGKLLVKASLQVGERDTAFATVSNWRLSHSLPLQVLRNSLSQRARKIDSSAVVVQRLKRLTSITSKLHRAPHMKLSQMQDIGGCRAVLNTIEQVDQLVSIYEADRGKDSPDKSKLDRWDNYILEPKPDGYRGVHYIYKYRSLLPAYRDYNNHRIEIQIRSRLQHAWATAVETVSTFTDQPLKSGGGEGHWKDFFALMGSVIAMLEGRSLVPGRTNDKKDLVRELKGIVQLHRIDFSLRGWGVAAPKAILENEMEAEFYVLELDMGKNEVRIMGFSRRELSIANDEYLRLEKAHADDPCIQTVLVSADSLAALQRAYPNYYLDMKEFLDVLLHILHLRPEEVEFQ